MTYKKLTRSAVESYVSSLPHVGQKSTLNGIDFSYVINGEDLGRILIHDSNGDIKIKVPVCWTYSNLQESSELLTKLANQNGLGINVPSNGEGTTYFTSAIESSEDIFAIYSTGLKVKKARRNAKGNQVKLNKNLERLVNPRRSWFSLNKN